MEGVELALGLIRPSTKPRAQNSKMGVQWAPGGKLKYKMAP